MKRYLIIILTVLFPFSLVKSQSKAFYYSGNIKVELSKLENKAVIKLAESQPSLMSAADIKSSLGILENEYKVKLLNRNMFVLEEDEKMVDVFINENANSDKIKKINSVYKDKYGTELYFTDELIIKLKKDISEKEEEKLLKKHKLVLSKKHNTCQVFNVSKHSNILTLSQEIYETGLVEYAYPLINLPVELHRHIPNDQYFNRQITCHNTGQVFTDGHSGTLDADIDAPEAWDITRGDNNIIVAVIDQGVTPNHPDLPNARQVRLNGSNFGNGNPNDPSPTGNDNHGNSCAGVIAATMDNNQGIAGIAPNCRIMPIRLSFGWGGSTTADIADAIRFAVNNGADIISNSWGFGTSNPNFDAGIRNEIQNAINNGVVVVFSAGNTANHASGNNGQVNFPSNVNINGVITVGASDRNDSQANYSPTSNAASANNQIIDLTAPSHRAYSSQIAGETFEMWSIDIPGAAGYNEVHSTDGGTLPVVGSQLPNAGVNFLSYTGRFGGTSHSCPVISGVAALILSINPNLTPQQVFDILTNSANQVGGYVYNGNGWSEELGFGRVNAFNSVMTACPDNYNINWDIESGEDLEYQAGNYITAEGNIAAGANVEIHAANSVRLTPGFQASNGSTLRIFTQGCGTVLKNAETSNHIAYQETPLKNNSTQSQKNIENNHAFECSIYPNPTNGRLNIELENEGDNTISIVMYDYSGSMILNFTEQSSSFYIDLSNVHPGMYVMRLSNGERTLTKKIIKN